MATITCKASVKEDGSLALPPEAREQLGLQPGDQVEVRVTTGERKPEKPQPNPLYDIIGIAKGGPADGADKHDAYLYGKKPT